jgi:signal transduction histidine kinase
VPGVEMQPLDLVEWPLMFIISLLVAVMADRAKSTGRQYAALYRAASDRLLTAQEDEQHRISLDLHDGVGQTLAALVLTLDAAESVLRGGKRGATGQAEGLVGRSKELAAQAIEETRAITLRLVPARITATGLAAAVRDVAASISGPVSVTLDPAVIRPGLLPPQHEVIAFRIIQEALSNALRHSQATSIRITIEIVGDRLHAVVLDDGCGFVPSRAVGQGLGLAGMDERAAMIHGTLIVRSALGRGTKVDLSIPLATQPLEAEPPPLPAPIATSAPS